MNGFLFTLHIIVSILLVGGILLQPGSKGGGLGATFGGGSANSAFGARGAAPLLSKVTYWLAAGFMAMSLVIEVVIVKNSRSVLDRGTSVRTVPSPASPQLPAPQK
ncbi:MAG TPA: preprotein translocase subunit SecG [Holophaga sp.]|jgi:preprotein translocase subunit SecG|nr:preprotein translocase subunit SecG [Holophaga sp.]